MAYKTTEYTSESGTKYVFVTRGKSKPFTQEEISLYLSLESKKAIEEGLRQSENEEFVDPPEIDVQSEVDPRLNVPKEREKLFLADLKFGLEFCKKKYGATDVEVISAAYRCFPSLNLQKLWENNGIKR